MSICIDGNPKGQGKVFRNNHLIRLVESIKKQNNLLLPFQRTKNFYCYVYPIKFTVLKIFTPTQPKKDAEIFIVFIKAF